MTCAHCIWQLIPPGLEALMRGHTKSLASCKCCDIEACPVPLVQSKTAPQQQLELALNTVEALRTQGEQQAADITQLQAQLGQAMAVNEELNAEIEVRPAAVQILTLQLAQPNVM